MERAQILADKNFTESEIDPRLFGSFLEHMGRVVYGGIYEPENPCSDEDGFRKDVLEKTKEIGVTEIRYPGGNFASEYHWEDGVGPKKERPHRMSQAWRSVETNEFGTNEFMKWAVKAGVKPMLTLNLGTGSLEEAVHYVEYCNAPAGNKYGDLRIRHGVQEPYGVKLWCLGNEMDGEWQIGHKSAKEYGKLAAEIGKAIKRVDPQSELAVCGSSLSSMPSFPSWDMQVLDLTYDIADYLSLHQYYGGQEKGTAEFLAQALDMEEYIQTIRSVLQLTKKKKQATKDIKISLDEWGVWAVPPSEVDAEVEEKAWQVAPAISEQIYTLEDALLFASMQMVMLRNADLIKIACQSLLTNISACIMTEPRGGLWLQTTYYPFFYFAKYAHGVTLHSVVNGPCYACDSYQNVPYIDHVMVWNETAGELIVYLVNRGEESVCAEVKLLDFVIKGIRECTKLVADDRKATNAVVHDAVIPRENPNITRKSWGCEVLVDAMSFNIIRLEV